MKVKVMCRKFECRKNIHYKTQYDWNMIEQYDWNMIEQYCYFTNLFY